MFWTEQFFQWRREWRENKALILLCAAGILVLVLLGAAWREDIRLFMSKPVSEIKIGEVVMLAIFLRAWFK